jgi:hypothetical protein
LNQPPHVSRFSQRLYRRIEVQKLNFNKFHFLIFYIAILVFFLRGAWLPGNGLSQKDAERIRTTFNTTKKT